MTHNTELTILSTVIRRDAEGRYSLSDCWGVSGKDKKNQPSKWFESEKTQEFLRALEGDPENRATSISVVTTGPNDGRGYWADRKAVIHYATWISADFYLTVIRAFDDLVMDRVQIEQPREAKPKRIRKPAFDVAFERCLRVTAHIPGMDENQRLLMAARGTKELSGVNPLELMGITSVSAPTQDNYLTPTEIGKQIGLSAIATNKLIINIGYQVKAVGSSASSDYTMTEAGMKYGRMFDTTRKHGKGSQQQLKWSPDLVGILRTAMIAGEGKPVPFAKSPERATT